MTDKTSTDKLLCILGLISFLFRFRKVLRKDLTCLYVGVVSGSETSSEHSVGTQSVGGESISSKNTLLASGTSHSVQLAQLDENMRILSMDPGLLNPDKLWERPESG